MLLVHERRLIMNWADAKTPKTVEIISCFTDQIQYLTCLKIWNYFNKFVYISKKSANIVKIHFISKSQNQIVCENTSSLQFDINPTDKIVSGMILLNSAAHW